MALVHHALVSYRSTLRTQGPVCGPALGYHPWSMGEGPALCVEVSSSGGAFPLCDDDLPFGFHSCGDPGQSEVDPVRTVEITASGEQDFVG